MEIILGIDNLIFISILTNKLPERRRVTARAVGMGLAVVFRLALLATISVVVALTEPLFELLGHGFSWRDLILIAGGLFLVWKATNEIHHTVDPQDHQDTMVGGTLQLSLAGAVFQILLLDLVFSIDSIITAVGMTDEIAIMYIAVIVAVPLFALGLNRWLRLLIALPVFLSALGFLQAKHRFCVAYAASGMQNASGASMDGAKKVSAADRAKDKLKSNKIYLQGAAIAVVVAAIAVALP